MKWKNNLLSSGFILEYEAAKIADDLGFEIIIDYTYSRFNEQGVCTDFSIDLFATKLIQKDGKELLLCLPVECKHRFSDAIWLFLPDFVPEEEFETGHMMIEEFSKNQKLRYGDTYLYFRYTGRTRKGIEIKGDSVYDKEMKHGLQQLKYALPKASIDALWGQRLEYSINDRLFLIVPVLLTTAKLRLAKKEISIQELQSFDDIGDLGTEVGHLLYVPGHSLDYNKHCYNTIHHYKDCKIPRYFESDQYVRIKDIQGALIKSVSDPIINICNFNDFRYFLNSFIKACYEDLELKSYEV